MNSSGTGKTRLTLEGLCQNWGIYVSAERDINFVGSSTMGTVLKARIPRDASITHQLPDPDSLGYTQMRSHNLAIVERHFKIALLAHLMTFSYYLNIANVGDIDGNTARQRWVLFQISSSAVGSPDFILDIALELESSPESELEALITETLVNIQNICREPLFLILDEANVPARMLSNAFRDNEGNYHSVLMVLLRTWQTLIGDSFTFIVSGTDIPREYFRGDVWSCYQWTSNTGAYEDQQSQLSFVQRIVPPWHLSNESGQALLDRLWIWFRFR
jgi:hypothetical protein